MRVRCSYVVFNTFDDGSRTYAVAISLLNDARLYETSSAAHGAYAFAPIPCCQRKARARVKALRCDGPSRCRNFIECAGLCTHCHSLSRFVMLIMNSYSFTIARQVNNL